MSSVSNAARRRILLACFVMSLFTFAATIKFNRHCSICSKPVKVENALTLGVLGYLDDFDIIHESCMAARKEVGGWLGTSTGEYLAQRNRIYDV